MELGQARDISAQEGESPLRTILQNFYCPIRRGLASSFQITRHNYAQQLKLKKIEESYANPKYQFHGN